jgi:hypothetical protein
MSVCIKGSTEAHLLAIAERLQDKRAIEMQQHSRDEFVRLAPEFDVAVMS